MVSILLCTYNRENLIRETIDSILAQTYTDFELLIVDDGSTSEEAKEILKSYKDERIRLLLCEENKFYCRAANFGISQMKGDYLAIADSDDLWYPTKLERQMEYLEEHPECGACFTYAEIIDENGEPAAEDFPDIAELTKKSFATRGEWMRYFFRDGNCVVHPSVVIPTWMVKRVKGFNLLMCQGADLDMWIRVLREAPIYVLPEFLTKFRCHHNPYNQISGADELKTARFMNEHMLMRKKMMRILTDTELKKYFHCDFRNKDSQSHLELEIERAFLLMECVKGLPELRVLGIEKFEEILDTYGEEAAIVLKEKYHTTLQNIYEWNLGHFYVDFGIHVQMAKRVERQQELEKEIQHNAEGILKLQKELQQLNGECEKLRLQENRLIKEKEELQRNIDTTGSKLIKTQSNLEKQKRENDQMLHELEVQVVENIKLQEINGRKIRRKRKNGK